MIRFISFMLVTWAVQARSECIQYTFENGVGLAGNDSTMCGPFPMWELGTYSTADVDSPHAKSTNFVAPLDRTSCFTSPIIPMSYGGTLEINVYADSAVGEAVSLSIVVSEVVEDGAETIVAASTLPQTTTPGWHVVSINILGSSSFNGHVSFLGHSSTGSNILIDAIRYIPPGVDASDCILYEDDELETTTETEATEATTEPDTTTESGTTTESEVITTVTPEPEADDVEECVTFNFEADTENLFDDDNYLCSGFVSWNVQNYTEIGVDSQNAYSENALTPNELSSCTASFAFPMTPGGVVEVNVYVEPTTNVDHVIVLVKNLVSTGVDTVAGFQIFEPSRSSFVRGWSVIEIPIASLSTFNGYLVFLGSAADGSKVLVDSFRYIPPGTPVDHESCAIY